MPPKKGERMTFEMDSVSIRTSPEKSEEDTTLLSGDEVYALRSLLD